MSPTTTMRVFEAGHGDASVTERERPVPIPGAGEVLVRVEARSINARDLPIVAGRYTMLVPPGRVPLSDGAGVVVAAGDGVSRFAPGDRVTSLFHPGWVSGRLPGWDDLYGVARDGWLAEYVAVSEQSVMASPEHLSDEEAATLPCAGVTAWSALTGTGAGDTVLVQGTGGVSVFALQFARLCGARVLATTSSPARAERLRELGASAVVDRTRTPEWGAAVGELTGGRGVDLVVDIGGAGSVAQSLRALALGGRLSLVGNLGEGPGLDPGQLIARAATARAITVGSRADAEQMLRVVSLHRLHPVIDRVFPFREAPAAFAHAETGARTGKVVIGR